jgi:hypothetical protein
MSNKGTSFIVDTPLGTSFIVDTPLGTSFIVDTPALGTSLEELYIASLDEMDKIALNVARTTMGSLFSLSKSTAFIEWTKQCNKKQMDA